MELHCLTWKAKQVIDTLILPSLKPSTEKSRSQKKRIANDRFTIDSINPKRMDEAHATTSTKEKEKRKERRQVQEGMEKALEVWFAQGFEQQVR